jgi:hypothetical protein
MEFLFVERDTQFTVTLIIGSSAAIGLFPIRFIRRALFISNPTRHLRKILGAGASRWVYPDNRSGTGILKSSAPSYIDDMSIPLGCTVQLRKSPPVHRRAGPPSALRQSKYTSTECHGSAGYCQLPAPLHCSRIGGKTPVFRHSRRQAVANNVSYFHCIAWLISPGKLASFQMVPRLPSGRLPASITPVDGGTEAPLADPR